MKRLIRLELRKNNIKPYIYSCLGIFCFTITMGLLLMMIPQINPTDELSKMVLNYKSFVLLITTVSMTCYAIMGSIMHASFTVDEYTGKRNVLLFSYPQRRSQILFAKCALIFGFISIAMFCSNVINILLINVIGYHSGLTTMQIGNIGWIIKVSILFTLVANVVILISLRIGMWKRSIIITIVTSVILVSPFGNSAMLLADSFLSILIVACAIFLAVAIILFRNLFLKVNSMEC